MAKKEKNKEVIDMYILGIESSCDETAAAVVNEKGKVLSSVVFTQLEEHLAFGGVVPEIAARAHLQRIDQIIEQAVKQAGISFADLSAIGAAAGPGLIGGVIVGVMTAKAMALALDIPFIAVNHLEGHALAAFLDAENNQDIDFPFLLLLTSGGHCQILEANGVGKYKLLGRTIDDAAGEAFDKVAKMLGIGYPGGPQIEKMAKDALNSKRFALPRPLKGKPNCDFSFSGLKTAVRRIIEESPELSYQDKCDLCAVFQDAVTDVMHWKMKRAVDIFKQDCPQGKHLVVAGGVAANQQIRSMLKTLAEEGELVFAAPPIKLCTDNGAMIAYAALRRLMLGMVDGLDFRPRPRWPLYE